MLFNLSLTLADYNTIIYIHFETSLLVSEGHVKKNVVSCPLKPLPAGADLQGGLGGLQPPLQLLQPWISEVGDEEEEVEERRKWREGEEEEEINPP